MVRSLADRTFQLRRWRPGGRAGAGGSLGGAGRDRDDGRVLRFPAPAGGAPDAHEARG